MYQFCDLDNFFRVEDTRIVFDYRKAVEVLGEEIADKLSNHYRSAKNQPPHNCDLYEFHEKSKAEMQKLVKITYWQAWKAIMCDVNTKYGAPMGRPNVGGEPDGDVKVYQRHVVLDQGYDSGGAYWGIGRPLYVRFTKDLQYVEFFRA